MIIASVDGGRARKMGRRYLQGVVDIALDAAVLVILAGLSFAATLGPGPSSTASANRLAADPPAR